MGAWRARLAFAARTAILLGTSGCTPVEWGCLLSGAERIDDVDHSEHDVRVEVRAPAAGTLIGDRVTFEVVVDDAPDTPAVDLHAEVYFESPRPLCAARGPRATPLTLVCEVPDHASGELVFDVAGYVPWAPEQRGEGRDSVRLRLRYQAPWVAELQLCGPLECVRPIACQVAGEVVLAGSARRDKDRLARAVFSIDDVVLADVRSPPFRVTWDSATAAGPTAELAVEVHDVDGRVARDRATCTIDR